MSHKDWKVGDRVVCVGCKGTPKPDGFWERWQSDWGIVKTQRGEVYTIRDMRVGKDGNLRIRVREIVNPVIQFIDASPQEPWFHADGFRSAHVNKTDISIFIAMLNRTGVNA